MGRVEIQQEKIPDEIHNISKLAAMKCYLPTSQLPSTIYSLAITLWTAIDYNLEEDHPPTFSDNFSRILVSLSSQEDSTRPRIDEVINKLKSSNNSNIIDKSAISSF